MDISELRAELGRKEVSIPKLAKAIGIGKKAMYQRFDGIVQFKQNEITAIKNYLGLSEERVIAIFFN